MAGHHRLAVVSLGLFIGSSYIGSLSTILTDAISAIGLQICVYYGLAIGFIPMAIYWPMGSAYFKQRPALGAVVPADAGV